ncbi:LolA family protein [Marinilabilia rubra]|uniref:Cell envelope biogenesis protein LolA n=1 Tax=Marinilabilia rubra TaxID=2162893 RepID=A0A2U2BAJ8_9BACT|nr:outer membrane lipoprotein carrier protein LolA [Marinilabilia rubra]PWE00095.1 cell envelope biogenesis protein LolA [Marinilabilia rubra]
MRNIFATVSLMIFLAGSTVFAQSPEVLKAKEVLDKVSEVTQSYNSIKADFTFSLENTQADITDSHDGTIFISGDKYKATVMNVTSYFDGVTLWTHLKEVGEVNISTPDPMDETTLSPSNIFNIHENGFRYIFAGEEMLKGKKVNIIDLFPEDRDKPFSRIKLYVNKSNNHISKIMQLGKDGNNYIIDIKEMKTNVPVEPSMFKFNEEAHPDVDVIDMR